jgi:hypothetical protein
MVKLFLFITSLTAIVSCSNNYAPKETAQWVTIVADEFVDAKFEKIKTGMSPNEAENILGKLTKMDTTMLSSNAEPYWWNSENNGNRYYATLTFFNDKLHSVSITAYYNGSKEPTTIKELTDSN